MDGPRSGAAVQAFVNGALKKTAGDRPDVAGWYATVLVIADEAHRNQYDFIDGFARHIRRNGCSPGDANPLPHPTVQLMRHGLGVGGWDREFQLLARELRAVASDLLLGRQSPTDEMRNMAALVWEYRQLLRSHEGMLYRVGAWGEKAGHVWHGWLEFVPAESGVPLRTPRETTQPTWETLRYWASGLQPSYFEGAFGRARPLLTDEHHQMRGASFTPAEGQRLLAMRADYESGRFADDRPGPDHAGPEEG